MNVLPDLAPRLDARVGAAVGIVLVAGVGVVVRVPVPLVGIKARVAVDVLVAANKSDEKQPHPPASRGHPARLQRPRARWNQESRPSPVRISLASRPALPIQGETRPGVGLFDRGCGHLRRTRAKQVPYRERPQLDATPSSNSAPSGISPRTIPPRKARASPSRSSSRFSTVCLRRRGRGTRRPVHISHRPRRVSCAEHVARPRCSLHGHAQRRAPRPRLRPPHFSRPAYAGGTAGGRRWLTDPSRTRGAHPTSDSDLTRI